MLCGPTRFMAWWAGYSTRGLAIPSCSMTPWSNLWMSVSETRSGVLRLYADVVVHPNAHQNTRPHSMADTILETIFNLQKIDQIYDGHDWQLWWCNHTVTPGRDSKTAQKGTAMKNPLGFAVAVSTLVRTSAVRRSYRKKHNTLR